MVWFHLTCILQYISFIYKATTIIMMILTIMVVRITKRFTCNFISDTLSKIRKTYSDTSGNTITAKLISLI